MLPQLARCILSEFGTMSLNFKLPSMPYSGRHRALSHQVRAEEVHFDLAAENNALSALNTDLESTIDGKVCT